MKGVGALGVATLLVFGAGAALSACDVPPKVTRRSIRLRLLEDTPCDAPGAVDSLTLRALGDFPTSNDTVETREPGTLPTTLHAFPVDAQLLLAEASVAATAWGAAGTRRLADLVEVPKAGPASLATTGENDLLLLPFGQGCPYEARDPSVPCADSSVLCAPPGAKAAAHPEGALAVVGGTGEDGTAVRRWVLLRPGQVASERPSGLRIPRTFATVTPVVGGFLVAGGAEAMDTLATDTFEVLDLSTGDTALSAGALSDRRQSHGAGPLPDGRVLLVGGLSRPNGPALRTAEIIDPLLLTARTLEGTLPSGRIEPHVIRLTDGTVLVLGGYDDQRAFEEVLALDATADGFARALTMDGQALGVPGRRRSVAVVLPGARVAWLGDDTDLSPSSLLTVLSREPPYLPGPPVFRRVDLSLAPELAGLVDVRALALPNGQLLVTGRGTEGARAALVDLGAGEASLVPADRVPAHLLPWDHGAVAELGPDGSALRRAVIRTPFDNPPTTLLGGDPTDVVLDSPGSWVRERGRFVSTRNHARIDVPALLFSDVSLELEVEAGSATGPVIAELLLLPEAAPPVAIARFVDRAGLPRCEVAASPDVPLRVTRRGQELLVDGGLEARSCAARALSGRVGVAVRAAAGARLGDLRIRRLAD